MKSNKYLVCRSGCQKKPSDTMVETSVPDPDDNDYIVINDYIVLRLCKECYEEYLVQCPYWCKSPFRHGRCDLARLRGVDCYDHETSTTS